MDLTGRVVLITGANGALGSAVADQARALGGKLVLFDLVTGDAPAEGDRWFALDLTDADAVNTAAREVGNVDVLFHIAGGFDMGPTVYEQSPESFSRLFDMNVTTFQNVSRAFVPGMVDRGNGAIVTIGALGAAAGQANMGAYGVAKSAVLRLTESLSAEVRAQGVNVNCVLPSIIDTPANRSDMPGEDHGAWVSPEDLAKVICFLGSDAARAIHGAAIPVRGLV